MRKLATLAALLLLSVTTFAANKSEKSDPLSWSAGNTSAKIGGFVHVVTSVDFGGAIDNEDFIPAYAPVQEKWQSMNQFDITPSYSQLNLSVTQKSEKLGDIKGYVEIDFRGVGSTVVRLRHAYLTFMGFIAGQTNSRAMDIAASVATIDVQGTNLRTLIRTPLISYEYAAKSGFSTAVSLECPAMLGFTGDYFYSAIDDNSLASSLAANLGTATQSTPDMILYLQQRFSNGHIRIGGIYRNLRYHDLVESTVRRETGYAVQMSGSVNIAKPVKIVAQGIYGVGVARYINDLARIATDLLPDKNNPGQMVALPMYGGAVGITAKLSEKLLLTGNYSIAYLERGDENTYYPLLYNHGDYVSASLFYSCMKNLTFGAEYLFGSHTTLDDSYAQANRAQVMVKYAF
ncbi:MAG: DcaP family trimeric outer membrane transporter [Rikenellaceae bacterium]